MHVKNISAVVMHILGGRLYGVRMIGQHEILLEDREYGVKPSAHKPSLTLLGSNAKVDCVLLKCFQASPSDG